ncbi:Phasin protein [Cohaesibacter marisflavi]|uniref:Phasin protein n=1 Tax=Cohaesibacter marisflavi TaxID=655353 RepID=A0A1I5DDX4_9HYPH|nr:phasin family protein [Cohaesibacter marisflavi]SFN97468.1 Phasin protein [Cohaesibacter marisflavi]
MSSASGFFEIPEEFRTLTERGIEHSFQAYESFRDAASDTAERFEKPARAINSALVDANKKAFSAADEGMKASFELATDLARATSVQEAMMLQTKYMQSQMMRFGEVASAMAEMATRMSVGATPQNKSE